MLCLLWAVLGAQVLPAPGPMRENDGWPVAYRQNAGGPLVVDVDGDGELDVISSDGGAWSDVDIMAWSSDGFPLEGWPKYMKHRMEGAIPGADFDNDGRIEVVVVPYRTTEPTEAVVYRHDGTLPRGWPVELKWMSFGGVSFMDLDGDGKLEIGCSVSEQLASSAVIHVFNWRGTDLPGWPKALDRQIQSSVVYTDLDMDGDLEILVGACLVYVGPGWIYAYHHDGTPFAETAILAEVSGGLIIQPMSVADLQGDLHPEIIAPDRGTKIHVIDWQGDPVQGWPPEPGFGHVEGMPVAIGARGRPAIALLAHQTQGGAFLYDRRGQLAPGWPWERNCRCYAQFVVADLDGDPDPEGFMSGCPPGDWALNLDGSVVDRFPINLEATFDQGTATLADLDSDGDTEIILHSSTQVHAYDTPGVWDPDRIECARWMYDNWHTGSYHKLIYREAESANGRAGWSVASDTSAWGHAFVRPSSELIAVTERSAGGSTEARAAVARASLHYRTEVPAFKKYSLWVRARRRQDDTGATTALPKIVATLDGFPWRPTGQVAASPGRWRWIELGRRTLQVGLHELDLSVHGAAIEIDRWLLTTHERLPILEERPHGW